MPVFKCQLLRPIIAKLKLSFGHPRSAKLAARRHFALWLFSSWALLTTPVQAEVCLVDWLEPPRNLSFPADQQRLVGQNLEQTDANTFWLTGHVEIQQDGLWIHADQAIYQRDQQTALVFGQVRLQQSDLLLHAPSLRYFASPQQAFADDIRYQFIETRAHGHAAHIHALPEQNQSYFRQATYTTCALDNPDWTLRGRDLELNQNTRRLYVKHARLDFYGVPIFYSPYLDIPLDERATGLLFPYIGSVDAPQGGTPLGVFAQPYFINLAPNLDTTLTLIAIEQRGVMLDNEWRYLQPRHRGELSVSFLNDQLVQDQGLSFIGRGGNPQTMDASADRWRLSFAGQQAWSRSVRSNLVWHEVSDPDFYNDLPTNFTETSGLRTRDTRLERRAELRFNQGAWRGELNYLGFLPLRNGENNYLEKAPELRLGYSENFGQLRFSLNTERTEFVRYNGFNDFQRESQVRGLINRQQMGERWLVQPRLDYRISDTYGFMNAFLQANQRHYQVINPNAQTDAASDNLVWQGALRGGLIFERDLNLFNQAWQQTLEPEVQYLYVPYVDQSRLPVYDSGTASLDFSNLFQLNRFSGIDRIGDTEQVSVAVNTRFIDPEGAPKFDAGIGQIFYLRDRQVNLRGSATATEPRSDYFLRLRSFFAPFSATSTSQWDDNTLELKQINNRLEAYWQPRLALLATHQGFNLNDENRRRQSLGLGTVYQLSQNWQFAGYAQMDLETDRTLQRAGGLRYESCCWASELIIEQAEKLDGRYNTTIKYVIEFKGLSNVGDRLADTLRRELDF
ncbi:LPS-assembly protein LptD [Thiomicrospira cyclica]|uniref:LPS-assembly protein LptD n=1 Tax=Thiomicrospira cyclica (strain DSM 14477 / JCM 11371 / ALM1) TaxID=717773 RepID=F6D9A6_THICA|nr:LPS assembly protein LptD [Thiomicrospira cyclica]AEG32033.1 Organic solvent tolerance protein [Thiomicrospira cyclica ALM1]